MKSLWPGHTQTLQSLGVHPPYSLFQDLNDEGLIGSYTVHVQMCRCYLDCGFQEFHLELTMLLQLYSFLTYR